MRRSREERRSDEKMKKPQSRQLTNLVDYENEDSESPNEDSNEAHVSKAPGGGGSAGNASSTINMQPRSILGKSPVKFAMKKRFDKMTPFGIKPASGGDVRVASKWDDPDEEGDAGRKKVALYKSEGSLEGTPGAEMHRAHRPNIVSPLAAQEVSGRKREASPKRERSRRSSSRSPTSRRSRGSPGDRDFRRGSPGDRDVRRGSSRDHDVRRGSPSPRKRSPGERRTSSRRSRESRSPVSESRRKRSRTSRSLSRSRSCERKEQRRSSGGRDRDGRKQEKFTSPDGNKQRQREESKRTNSYEDERPRRSRSRSHDRKSRRKSSSSNDRSNSRTKQKDSRSPEKRERARSRRDSSVSPERRSKKIDRSLSDERTRSRRSSRRSRSSSESSRSPSIEGRRGTAAKQSESTKSAKQSRSEPRRVKSRSPKDGRGSPARRRHPENEERSRANNEKVTPKKLARRRTSSSSSSSSSTSASSSSSSSSDSSASDGEAPPRAETSGGEKHRKLDTHRKRAPVAEKTKEEPRKSPEKPREVKEEIREDHGKAEVSSWNENVREKTEWSTDSEDEASLLQLGKDSAPSIQSPNKSTELKPQKHGEEIKDNPGKSSRDRSHDQEERSRDKERSGDRREERRRDQRSRRSESEDSDGGDSRKRSKVRARERSPDRSRNRSPERRRRSRTPERRRRSRSRDRRRSRSYERFRGDYHRRSPGRSSYSRRSPTGSRKSPNRRRSRRDRSRSYSGDRSGSRRRRTPSRERSRKEPGASERRDTKPELQKEAGATVDILSIPLPPVLGTEQPAGEERRDRSPKHAEAKNTDVDIDMEISDNEGEDGRNDTPPPPPPPAPAPAPPRAVEGKQRQESVGSEAYDPYNPADESGSDSDAPPPPPPPPAQQPGQQPTQHQSAQMLTSPEKTDRGQALPQGVPPSPHTVTNSIEAITPVVGVAPPGLPLVNAPQPVPPVGGTTFSIPSLVPGTPQPVVAPEAIPTLSPRKPTGVPVVPGENTDQGDEIKVGLKNFGNLIGTRVGSGVAMVKPSLPQYEHATSHSNAVSTEPMGGSKIGFGLKLVGRSRMKVANVFGEDSDDEERVSRLPDPAASLASLTGGLGSGGSAHLSFVPDEDVQTSNTKNILKVKAERIAEELRRAQQGNHGNHGNGQEGGAHDNQQEERDRVKAGGQEGQREDRERGRREEREGDDRREERGRDDRRDEREHRDDRRRDRERDERDRDNRDSERRREREKERERRREREYEERRRRRQEERTREEERRMREEERRRRERSGSRQRRSLSRDRRSVSRDRRSPSRDRLPRSRDRRSVSRGRRRSPSRDRRISQSCDRRSGSCGRRRSVSKERRRSRSRDRRRSRSRERWRSPVRRRSVSRERRRSWSRERDRKYRSPRDRDFRDREKFGRRSRERRYSDRAERGERGERDSSQRKEIVIRRSATPERVVIARKEPEKIPLPPEPTRVPLPSLGYGDIPIDSSGTTTTSTTPGYDAMGQRLPYQPVEPFNAAVPPPFVPPPYAAPPGVPPTVPPMGFPPPLRPAPFGPPPLGFPGVPGVPGVPGPAHPPPSGQYDMQQYPPPTSANSSYEDLAPPGTEDLLPPGTGDPVALPMTSPVVTVPPPINTGDVMIPQDDVTDRQQSQIAEVDFPESGGSETGSLSGSGSGKQNKANLVAIEPLRESQTMRRNIQVVEVEVHAPMNKQSPRSALRYIEPVSSEATSLATPRVGASPTEGLDHYDSDVDSATSRRDVTRDDVMTQSVHSTTSSSSRKVPEDMELCSSESGSEQSRPEEADGTESIGGMLGQIFRNVKAKFKDTDSSGSEQQQPEGKKKKGRGRKKAEDDGSDTEEGAPTRRRSSRLKSLEDSRNSANNSAQPEKKKRTRKSKWDVPGEDSNAQGTVTSTESPSAQALRTSGEFCAPGTDGATLPLKVKDRWRRWSEQDGTPSGGGGEPVTPPPGGVNSAKSPLDKFKEKIMSPEKLSSEPPVTARSPLQKFKDGLMMSQNQNPSLAITPILESVASRSLLQKYREEGRGPEAATSSTGDGEEVGKSPLQKFKEGLLTGLKLPEIDARQVGEHLRSPGKTLTSLENIKGEPKTPDVKKKVQPYEDIVDNIYLSERKGLSKLKKEARRMVCDCTLPSKEDVELGYEACGEDCLNRMLMIECGSRCACGDLCNNKRFQKHQYAKVGVFETHYKGRGLKALDDLDPGTFLMEYVGEVLDYREFKKRTKRYDTDDKVHHYFMALNADQIIDATRKGSMSRFINHSCDPNSETQKWTVNGQLRVGFFTIKPVREGEELTFDYQFETYGETAQKCHCGAVNCRGYIGGNNKQSPIKTDRKENKKKRRRELFDDVSLEEEIDKMLALEGMKRKEHVLELSRLMVRAENPDHRLSLLKLIQDTKEAACLRLFLDYHGLELLWSWAVDIPPNAIDLRTDIMNILRKLPITNKTVLKDSKIWGVIEKWSTQSVEAATGSVTPSAATPTTTTPAQSGGDADGKTSGRSTPVAASGGENGAKSDVSGGDEAVLHKKRRLFRAAGGEKEVGSSSDGEGSESSHKDTKAAEAEDKKGEDEVSSTNRLNEPGEDEEGSKEEERRKEESKEDRAEERGEGDSSVVGSTSQDEEMAEVSAVGDSAQSQPEAEAGQKEGQTDTQKEGGDAHTDAQDAHTEVQDGNTEAGNAHTESQDAQTESQDANTESQDAHTDSGDMHTGAQGALAEAQDALTEAQAVTDDAHKDVINEEVPTDSPQVDAPQVDAPQEDAPQVDAPKVESQTSGIEKIKNLATDLLESWGNLKEIFKIPKIRVEERKKTERELDRGRDRDRHDRKRHRDDSPDHRQGSDKRHRHSDRDRDRERERERDRERSIDRIDEDSRKRPRRILLPTPPKGPKISKEEHRRRFEEQVKANDELAEQYKQMQEQAYQQYYTDPTTGLMYPQDPNMVYQDPNMAAYQDPNMAYQMQMQVDPVTGQMIQVATTEGQMVDPTTGQLVDPATGQIVAQQQMVDPATGQIVDPTTGQLVAQQMVDPTTGQIVAPQQQIVDPTTGQLVAQQVVDPTTGQLVAQQQQMVDPTTGQIIAPQQQMLSASAGQMVDPTTGQIVTSGAQQVVTSGAQQVMASGAQQVVVGPDGQQVILGADGQYIPATQQVVVDSTAQTGAQQQIPQQVVVDASGQPVSQAQAQAQQMQAVQVQYVDPTTPVVQQTYMQQPVQQYVQTVQQQVYYTTPQGAQVVVQQPVIQVTDPTQLQHLQQQLTQVPEGDLPPPPPSPPKQHKLPPNWKRAKDAEGKTYFYHTVTRQTQWDMPTMDDTEPESLSGELETPTTILEDHHKKKSKKGTTTAAADTSSEVAKRMKDLFLSKISSHIISCLNPYTKKDCKIGRITNTHDFKYLARKLTHGVLAKEMKHCKHHEDLEVNENVKAKAKDYVRKYMAKFGPAYKKGEACSP